MNKQIHDIFKNIMAILTPNGQFTMIKFNKLFAQSSEVKALAQQFTQQIINITYKSFQSRINFCKTDQLRGKNTIG